MSRLLVGPLVVLSALLLYACDDSGSGPDPVQCEAHTSSVIASVAVGAKVVFDWEPACKVAAILVEQDGSDVFWIAAPQFGETLTQSMNVIEPPYTYGVVLPGMESRWEGDLVAGETYDLVLWRILPEGSTASCLGRMDDGCLVAVRSFTR